MHCKRDQSQSVAAHENLPEVNLLKAGVTFQKNARALKLHLPQPGFHAYVISEIQLVCQTVYIEHSAIILTALPMTPNYKHY